MAKRFSGIISEIMPLVKEGSDLPFAITHEGGKWNINYFALNTNSAKDEMKAQSEEFLALLRKSDPYAVRHTGADFSSGSYAYVHDKVLCARLRAEYVAEPFGTVHGGEFHALINIAEDNISRFSQKVLNYLLEFDKPLHALYDLNQIPLYNRDNPYDEPYDVDRTDEFFEYLEYQIEDIISQRQHEQTAPGTSFDKMIDKIKPEVVAAGDEPFIIYRDVDGGWHSDFTQNHYGEPYEWIESTMDSDKAAFVARGQDFKSAKTQELYNDVLCLRLRYEYYNVSTYDMSAEHRKLYSLLNFFEDNVAKFSPGTLNYLIQFDRPLCFLDKNCSYNLETEHAGWSYNKSLAADAVDKIEKKVDDIINLPKDEADQNKQTQRKAEAILESGKIPGEHKRVIDGHYTEKFSVALAGREVFLASDEKEDTPYLVCTARRDNPFGVTEYFDGVVTADYLEAMREFVDRTDTLLGTLEQERAAFPAIQPTLTAADCITGGLDENLTGKVVVIKPDVFSPEYRTAEHQLKIVRGGFGASPDSRGNALFCIDLYTGKETRFERYDIAGVVDPAKLPQWAKDKLAEQCGEKLPPVTLSEKNQSAPAPPKSAKSVSKTEKRPPKKPSILAELDAAVKEVAQHAEHKTANLVKKRGDLEVD
ncbi:hypothetical protein FACS1894219_04860 [Clostridia bacterium]|nr:hypothetical protein FACS1894219_04860 [Clostridia bacterium]